MSQARYDGASVAVGSYILVAGGYSASNTDSAVVDIYDIATNTWSVSALSISRTGVAAAAVGTKAIIAGGYNYAASDVSDRIDIYDTSIANPALRWSAHGLSVPRYSIVAVTLDTRAFFMGGLDVSDGPLTSVDVYQDDACLLQPLACQHGTSRACDAVEFFFSCCLLIPLVLLFGRVLWLGGSCITQGQNSTCQCTGGYTGGLCQTQIMSSTGADEVSSTAAAAVTVTGSSGNSTAASTGSQPLVTASSTGPTNFSPATKSTLTTFMSVVVTACATALCYLAW